MANAQETDDGKSSDNSLEGQTLKPREDNKQVETKDKETTHVTHTPISDEKRRRFAFRPSHKAVFIGLAIVVMILGVNAGILAFLLKKESINSKAINDKGVSISPGTLSKLGVNDSQIGSSNEKLVVNPNAQFNSQLTVAGGVKIGGQLILNSTLNASNANLSQLQAGSTSINSLNVNGSATASTLSVRGNFAVNGSAQFQNGVTVAQLLSVDNNAAVSGNLSIGGDLSSNAVAAGQLVVSGPIQIGSHVITAGRTPGVQIASGAIGSNGTVSISGNDEAGTIVINTGAGSGKGPIVSVLFNAGYSTQPVVIITPLGGFAEFYLGNVTTAGFTVDSASGLASGSSYQINYIVEQ